MPTTISGTTGVSQIQDGTVATADIADDAVTNAKVDTIVATKLTGTIADARFPATLPAASGANLTALPAGNLTGTVADARISALTSSKLTGALPAISAANLTAIPAANITGTLPAISATNLTNVPKDITVGGRKNMVINGAMQVAQRGTSETGYTTTGYYTCDRWHHDKAAATGTFTQTQEADAPDGFKNSLKINCTTAGSSGDYNAIQTKLESQDTAHLAYGTSSAKSVTLSFWVKVSQTGTMQFNLIHHADAGTRQISYLYTISAANTWEKKTVTFPGDTVRVGDDDNTQGFYLEWFLSSYGGRTGSAVLTSWGAYTNAARFEGATISIGDSTSDTWQITGVQLEVGSTATDFEGRSYGEELALCKRYYEILGSTAVADYGFMYIGTNWTTVNSRYGLQWTVTKRASPTITESGTWYCRNSTGSSLSVTGKAFDQPSPYGTAPYVTVASGLSVGHASQIWGDDGQIYVDAEL